MSIAGLSLEQLLIKLTEHKYKLLLWLADYASISSEAKNKIAYEKLLNDYKHLLINKEQEFYKDLLKRSGTLLPVEQYTLVKNARKRINALQNNLFKKQNYFHSLRKLI